MRVLVTGASGFVGQHLVNVLVERGDEVVAWGFSDAVAAEGAIVDLRDAEAPDRHNLRGLEAVVHLAGLAQASRSFTEPAGYVATNTAMEINSSRRSSGRGAFRACWW